MLERIFPVLGPHRWISWEVAEEAYKGYAQRYPGSAQAQSLERMAERGGFYESELDEYVPGWRDK